MALYGVCGEDPGALIQDDCEVIQGGVRSLVLIPSEEYDGLDKEDAAALQALIDANTVYAFAKTEGEYAEPEAATIEGMGDDNTRTVDKVHTLTVMHNVIARNATYWNTISQRNDYYVGWRVGRIGDTVNAPFMMWSDAPCHIVASVPVPASKSEQVKVTATITWRNINNPTVLDCPTSIFS